MSTPLSVELYLTYTPLSRTDLPGKSAVVIDVLRASTSICAMLSAGAKCVIPMTEPGEAVDMWTKLGAETSVLAGERNGVRIENFQLGNSPREFTEESVGKKHVVLTTTNGTAAFNRTLKADTIFCGALVNVDAVVAGITERGKDVVIVCAGLEGGFSIEDTLCGGMIINELERNAEFKLELNDAASLARLLYTANLHRLDDAIMEGEHGRYLDSIGFGDDVHLAAKVNSMPVLPVLKDGRLVDARAVAAG